MKALFLLLVFSSFMAETASAESFVEKITKFFSPRPLEEVLKTLEGKKGSISLSDCEAHVSHRDFHEGLEIAGLCNTKIHRSNYDTCVKNVERALTNVHSLREHDVRIADMCGSFYLSKTEACYKVLAADGDNIAKCDNVDAEGRMWAPAPPSEDDFSSSAN